MSHPIRGPAIMTKPVAVMVRIPQPQKRLLPCMVSNHVGHRSGYVGAALYL